jgi:hypothetical protein
MGRDCEHGIRNASVPRNAGFTRHMWSAVDVPEASEMVVVTRWLPPGGIGDDMAVFSQKGFNDLEDPRVADGVLDEAAPVEHLIAKWGGLLRWVSSFIRPVFVKNSLEIRAQSSDFISIEHVMQDHVAIGLEAFHLGRDRVGAKSQVS